MRVTINWFLKTPNQKSINEIFQKINLMITKKLKVNRHFFYELNIVSDQKIQTINKLYRNNDTPTDVISFAFHDNEEIITNLMGEIYISLDTANKQALDTHVSLNERLAELMIHGLLHLLKYDHNTTIDAKKMFTLQNKILNHLKTIKLI